MREHLRKVARQNAIFNRLNATSESQAAEDSTDSSTSRTGMRRGFSLIGLVACIINIFLQQFNAWTSLGYYSLGFIGAVFMIVSLGLHENPYISDAYKYSQKAAEFLTIVGIGLAMIFPHLLPIFGTVAGVGLGLLVIIHIAYSTCLSPLDAGRDNNSAPADYGATGQQAIDPPTTDFSPSAPPASLIVSGIHEAADKTPLLTGASL